MAGWISSRLKKAEDLLHQIDQQAAESLKKNENLRSEEELGLDTLPKPSENRPLLKDQLKKKPIENHDFTSHHSSNSISGSSGLGSNTDFNKEHVSVDVPLHMNSKPSSISLTDSDWTELLSAPVKKDENKGPNGGQRVKVVSKDVRKKNISGNVVAMDVKRSQKGQNRGLRSANKSNDVLEGKRNGVDGRVSTSSSSIRTSTSSNESRNDKESVDTRDLEHMDLKVNLVSESSNEINKAVSHPKNKVRDKYESSRRFTSTPAKEKEMNTGLNEIEGADKQTVASRVPGTTIKSSSSISTEESDSETGSSSSSSDSAKEREREERRKRRQQILAEKAAAKAIDAIKQREDKVARLEGEKESLEKIIEEQSKEQVVEASKLQTTMMEVMDAVELEKQKHNNTRMETLSRLITLETTHADLTRSLASAQKNLEVEINKVSDLRQLVDVKQATLEELRRKISSYHRSNKIMPPSKGVEYEREILETEYSFLNDKVEQLQEKAKTFETNIGSTQRDLQNPTELEIELKRRLSQLTDRLIQKQAQVESLSSQKAMLQFKIEAVSRSLDENLLVLDSASTSGDVEAGIWKLRNTEVRDRLEEQIRSGKQHLGSFVRQLDYLFCTGAVFLKRNSTARIWALVYLVCLHLWVIYILTSHSSVSEDARSGAVISLENINNTGSI